MSSDTYQRILASAIDIISESGISGISASKLSRRAGISKSTLFHYFESTKEIPEAVLQVIFDELMKPIEENNSGNLKDYLTSLGDCLFDLSEDVIKVFRSFFSFYHESIFQEVYRNSIREYLNKSRQSLEKQLKALSPAEVSGEQITDIATLLIVTLDGVGLHSLMHGEQEALAAAWREQVKCICVMLDCSQE